MSPLQGTWGAWGTCNEIPPELEGCRGAPALPSRSLLSTSPERAMPTESQRAPWTEGQAEKRHSRVPAAPAGPALRGPPALQLPPAAGPQPPAPLSALLPGAVRTVPPPPRTDCELPIKDNSCTAGPCSSQRGVQHCSRGWEQLAGGRWGICSDGGSRAHGNKTNSSPKGCPGGARLPLVGGGPAYLQAVPRGRYSAGRALLGPSGRCASRRGWGGFPQQPPGTARPPAAPESPRGRPKPPFPPCPAANYFAYPRPSLLSPNPPRRPVELDQRERALPTSFAQQQALRMGGARGALPPDVS